jgi:hypothetical protein
MSKISFYIKNNNLRSLISSNNFNLRLILTCKTSVTQFCCFLQNLPILLSQSTVNENGFTYNEIPINEIINRNMYQKSGSIKNTVV